MNGTVFCSGTLYRSGRPRRITRWRIIREAPEAVYPSSTFRGKQRSSRRRMRVGCEWLNLCRARRVRAVNNTHLHQSCFARVLEVAYYCREGLRVIAGEPSDSVGSVAPVDLCHV